MARTYKRDSRGRFAGGGGGAKLPAPRARKVGSKPQRRQGLLIQRGSLARSQAKLAGKSATDKSIKGQLSLRSQKGAVTRGQKALAAAQQSGRIRLGARAGVIGAKRGGGKAAAAKSAAGLRFKPSAMGPAQKGLRVIARQNQIGEGRTGVKAKNAKRVKTRAGLFLLAMGGPTTYSRGKKKGELRPAKERFSAVTKNLKNKGERARAAGLVAGVLGNKPNSRRPKLSPLQRDKAIRAKKIYGVQSTAEPKPIPTLSGAQRRRAAGAKSKYGVKSTGGKTTASASGTRVRLTGRSIGQAARAQTRRARSTVESTRYMGEAPRGTYRQRTSRSQLNLFTGKADKTYGSFRRVSRSNANPRRRSALGVRRAQR